MVIDKLQKVYDDHTAVIEKWGGLSVQVPSQIIQAGWAIGIHGEAGVGKTSLAATAAQSAYGGRVVFIDAEGGVRSLGNMPNVDVIEVSTAQDIERVTNDFLTKAEIPWGTIVLDNLTEYQDIDMRAILKAKNKTLAEWPEFRENTQNMLALARKYRNLANKRGIMVIMIAADKPEMDDNGYVRRRDIGFTPALAQRFPFILDVIGYLEALDDARETRVLHLGKSKAYLAKFRRDRVGPAATIPTAIYDPSMVTILDTLIGGKPWPKDQHSAPEGSKSKIEAKSAKTNGDK